MTRRRSVAPRVTRAAKRPPAPVVRKRTPRQRPLLASRWTSSRLPAHAADARAGVPAPQGDARAAPGARRRRERNVVAAGVRIPCRLGRAVDAPQPKVAAVRIRRPAARRGVSQRLPDEQLDLRVPGGEGVGLAEVGGLLGLGHRSAEGRAGLCGEAVLGKVERLSREDPEQRADVRERHRVVRMLRGQPRVHVGGAAGHVRVVGVDVEVLRRAGRREGPSERLRARPVDVVGARRRGRTGDHLGARIARPHAGRKGLEVLQVDVRRKRGVAGGALRVDVRPEVRFVVGLVAQDVAGERRRQVFGKGPVVGKRAVRHRVETLIAVAVARGRIVPVRRVRGPLRHVAHGDDHLEAQGVRSVDRLFEVVQVARVARVAVLTLGRLGERPLTVDAQHRRVQLARDLVEMLGARRGASVDQLRVVDAAQHRSGTGRRRRQERRYDDQRGHAQHRQERRADKRAHAASVRRAAPVNLWPHCLRDDHPPHEDEDTTAPRDAASSVIPAPKTRANLARREGFADGLGLD